MKIKTRTLIIIPLLLVAAAVTAIIIGSISKDKTVITGMVEVTEIDVSSKLPGRVDSIFVVEGDMVEEGQLLAVLESREIDAKVEQARGAMEAARAQMDMARTGARPEEKRMAEKMYLQARHQLDLAQKTFDRVQNVYRDSVVSAQEFDLAEFRYKAAREQFDAAEARYEMVQNGARPEEIRAAEAMYHRASNAYREALVYKDETRLKSPARGEVYDLTADPGEMIAAGYPVVTLIDPHDYWIVLNVREDMVKYLDKEQVLDAEVPGLKNPNNRFKVTYIAPMADFATWKATNEKGGFDLKSFEIHLRPVDPVDGLRPGMTVRVEIDRNQGTEQ